MSEHTASAYERRAVTARLSLLVRWVLLLFIAASAIPALAHAAPPKPVLLGTEPPSSEAAPASSTTPLIVGKGKESVVTTVVGAWGDSPVTRALEPSEYEIRIFSNSNCAGEPVKTGSVATLENPGIQVAVAENSVTAFSAVEVNPEEPSVSSVCSNAIAYWEGTPPVKEGTPGGGTGGGGEGSGSTPGTGTGGGVSPAEPAGPPSPPHLRTNPGGWANDNTPTVTGSAPGAATVKLYTTEGCSGAPVAKGSAGQLAAGIVVPVAENTVTAFYGVSVGPTGLQSRCSDPAYYGEDSLAPHVRITMGPASKTRKRKVVIRFTDTTGDTPGTVFSCRVNGKKWKTCSSPLRLKHLHAHHGYTVKVKATDPAGNVSVKPAKRRFKVI